MLLQRTPDIDNSVDHWHGSLFIVRRTKDTPNSQILIAPLASPEDTRPLIEHREDVKIEDTCLADAHFAVIERSAQKGLQECRVFQLPESHDAADVRNCCLSTDLGMSVMVRLQ